MLGLFSLFRLACFERMLRLPAARAAAVTRATYSHRSHALPRVQQARLLPSSFIHRSPARFFCQDPPRQDPDKASKSKSAAAWHTEPSEVEKAHYDKIVKLVEEHGDKEITDEKLFQLYKETFGTPEEFEEDDELLEEEDEDEDELAEEEDEYEDEDELDEHEEENEAEEHEENEEDDEEHEEDDEDEEDEGEEDEVEETAAPKLAPTEGQELKEKEEDEDLEQPEESQHVNHKMNSSLPDDVTTLLAHESLQKALARSPEERTALSRMIERQPGTKKDIYVIKDSGLPISGVLFAILLHGPEAALQEYRGMFPEHYSPQDILDACLLKFSNDQSVLRWDF